MTQLVYKCYTSNFIVAHHLYIHDTKVHYTPDFIRLSYDQNTSFQVNIRFLRVLFLFIDMVLLTFQMLTFFMEIINIKVYKSYFGIYFVFNELILLKNYIIDVLFLSVILYQSITLKWSQPFVVKTFWEN